MNNIVSITVTNFGSCQLKISSSKDRNSKYSSSSDPGLAAAEAMNFARQYQRYSITGPKAVIDLIPKQLRQNI